MHQSNEGLEPKRIRRNTRLVVTVVVVVVIALVVTVGWAVYEVADALSGALS